MQEGKFDKKIWCQKAELDYPDRVWMVNDLVKNHKIKGLSYKQLIDSLGEPEHGDNRVSSYENAMSYEVKDDFNDEGSPIYIKSLVIYLNKDSIATSFKFTEWKKDN